MGVTLPAFSPMQESLFLSLCGRALDNRAARPILADTMADEIVRKLDYDYGKFRLSAAPIISVAHRAKKLDEVARRFILRHPDAVALDLGAGLDTRMFRVAPPSSVDWYDIDFPEVIMARRQLIPARPNAHNVGADLTDPNWLNGIPTDRPTMIVADGLAAFLSLEEMISLLNSLTNHFSSLELVFNGYSRFAIWAAKRYRGTQSVASLIKFPGFDDPREPERWIHGLRLVEEIMLTREPEVATFPLAMRLINRLLARSAALSRRGVTILHYRF
jgi:O-methyltransferase involved in polyketide biosynthesis